MTPERRLRHEARRNADREMIATLSRLREAYEECTCGAARYRHADGEGRCYATGCDAWESARQVALLPDTLEEARGER